MRHRCHQEFLDIDPAAADQELARGVECGRERELRDPNAISIVYDNGTGRRQRAVDDDKGGLNVMGVSTPF